VGWTTFQQAIRAGLPIRSLNKIPFEEFETKRTNLDGILLDVRSNSEFAKAHIQGAINIPYTRLRERFHELPDTKIYVHCGSGRRASLAASFLAEKQSNVTFVDGICKECERIALSEGVVH